MNIHLRNLIKVAGVYARFNGLSISHVSKLSTGGGKVLDNIKSGSDMTTNRLISTMKWFSEHWPEGANWPEGIERPPTGGTKARKGTSLETSVGDAADGLSEVS